MTTPISSPNALKALHVKLSAERQDYDFQPPVLVSHALDYATQPERLRRYAQQTVNARIMVLLASSTMTTQALLQTYLLGEQSRAAFPMLLATRSQLELFAVVVDAIRTVKANAGQHDKNFANRVHAVDEALINATFGTRSSVLKDVMTKAGLSRLRSTNEKDFEALTSKNILTRLEKLAKSGFYPECKDDYERLCEYVHPNWGMNMLHVVKSPVNEKLLRFSLTSSEPFERALVVSALPMHRAALGTLSGFDGLEPPFGIGEVTFVR
jgi:hypothetical protein